MSDAAGTMLSDATMTVKCSVGPFSAIVGTYPFQKLAGELGAALNLQLSAAQCLTDCQPPGIEVTP